MSFSRCDQLYFFFFCFSTFCLDTKGGAKKSSRLNVNIYLSHYIFHPVAGEVISWPDVLIAQEFAACYAMHRKALAF